MTNNQSDTPTQDDPTPLTDAAQWILANPLRSDHKWNRVGEKCEHCGDSDWMNSPGCLPEGASTMWRCHAGNDGYPFEPSHTSAEKGAWIESGTLAKLLHARQIAEQVPDLERQLSAARRDLEAERDCRRGHADNVRSSNMIIANLDKELAAERAKNAAPYWMIERKAAHGEPPAWWAGGPDFGRAAYCWTSDAANGIKFHDAPSATAAHIALMALRGIKQANREFHIERVTITEHMMWTPSAL